MLTNGQVILKNGMVKKINNVENIFAKNDRIVISYSNTKKVSNLFFNNIVCVVLVNEIDSKYVVNTKMRDISTISVFPDGTEIPYEISSVFTEDQDEFTYIFNAFSVVGKSKAVVSFIYPKVNLFGYDSIDVDQEELAHINNEQGNVNKEQAVESDTIVEASKDSVVNNVNEIQTEA